VTNDCIRLITIELIKSVISREIQTGAHLLATPPTQTDATFFTTRISSSVYHVCNRVTIKYTKYGNVHKIQTRVHITNIKLRSYCHVPKNKTKRTPLILAEHAYRPLKRLANLKIDLDSILFIR